MFTLTGIESHIDKGFGITADSYYKSAEHLFANHYEFYDSTQQAQMPENFLYRHSIELYLKSLIIIYHQKLQINYGTVPFDSDKPEIKAIDSKWISLYKCHFIDELYKYWQEELLIPNNAELKAKFPKGDWESYDEITELMSIVCKYDKDSSFFRYPITKNTSLDHKKFNMQKFKSVNMSKFIEEIQQTNKNTEKKGGLISLVVDENENIVEAFKYEGDILKDIRDALKKIAHYFYGIHTMTRCIMCEGM